MPIGNDVLDLGHRSCRARMPGDRLLDRILAPAEREWLERTRPGGPWQAPLWALWAAKEAAFKALSRTSGRRAVFSPATLVCDLVLTPVGPPGARSHEALSIRGSVRSDALPEPVTVRGTSDGEHLHVIGWTRTGPADAGQVEAGVERLTELPEVAGLRRHFTDAEWEGVHSAPSAIVRLEARERLIAMMARAAPGENGPRTVEILTSPGPDGRGRRGQTPPSVRVDGKDVAGWDLSLSHHGRYVAWALSRAGG